MATSGKIIFMAIGGAQEVGASCYYLNLGGENFLLDCGYGRNEGIYFAPKFNELLYAPFIQDFHQISHVFISHAHMDHIGALPDFLQLNERANVYMTNFTWQIMNLQLGDRLSRRAQDNISRVSFLQEIPLENISASFHQAGHIPGAMMVLFKFGGKNILYTGDYSTFATPLVNAAILPKVKIDVLILCGLHARHYFYRTNDAAFQKILRQIRYSLSCGRIACCQVNQISKGIELLSLLNKFLPDVEIFLSDKVMDMVYCFENLNLKIMQERAHPLKKFPAKPSVIISAESARFWNCEIINCDFSLHDDFSAVVNFVRKINPEICLVVHSPPDKIFHSDITIEQILIKEPDSRTNFIFPELYQPLEI